jgi:hypothetical protein
LVQYSHGYQERIAWLTTLLTNVTFSNFFRSAFCGPYIEVILQVEPKLSRRAESFAQPQRAIDSDCDFFVGNSHHARPGNAARLRKRSSRQPERKQKLLSQNFDRSQKSPGFGYTRSGGVRGFPQ